MTTFVLKGHLGVLKHLWLLEKLKLIDSSASFGLMNLADLVTRAGIIREAGTSPCWKYALLILRYFVCCDGAEMWFCL